MKMSNMGSTELAQFCQNLLLLLGGTELAAIDSHVRADLVTAFGTLPADLMAAEAAAQASQAQTNALFAARNAIIAEILVPARSTRDNLRASNAPAKQFEVCGFDFADTARSTYVAQTPSDLAVEGFSNGVNQGKFKGNNKSSAVLYEVWRREGDDGDWGLCTAVKRPKFTDEGVTPGQYYEYKVRARASKNVSLFSNSAVVYGLVKPS